MRVTTRSSRPRANSETSTCGACRPPSPSGTRPGLSVQMAYSPVSVCERPKPVKPGYRAAPRGSSGWSKRPSGSACQVSTIASGTTSPLPSYTAPRSQIAPGVSGGTTSSPPSQVRPIARYGPTVALGVVCSCVIGPPLPARSRTRSAPRSMPPVASAVAPLLARWRSLRCSLPVGSRLAAMLPRPSSRDVPVVLGLERRLAGAAQHDVPLEGQRPVVDGARVVEPADRQRPGGLRDGVEDRVLEEQRVVREVHLRDQALGERPAEQREVDVRRPPGVVVVAPRVGAGPDRQELVAALVVGHPPAQAVEVR